MQHLIDETIDIEFATNEVSIVVRVDERAWYGKQVNDYQK